MRAEPFRTAALSASAVGIAARRLSALVLGTLFALALGEAADRGFWFVRARLASARRGPGLFELYVIGESTAAGVPYDPRGGFPQIVSLLFDGRIHGRRIEIINIAHAGYTIYPQALAFSRLVSYRNPRNPGAVLIYSGHNDSFLWNQADRGRIAVGSSGFFRRSWLLSDILLFAERAGVFKGLRSLGTYGENMGWALDTARDAGLIPVVSTVIGNVADIEPSLIIPPDKNWEEVRRLLAKGDSLEASGRAREAAAYYASLKASLPDTFLYLDYRRACCYRRLGEYDAARELFWKVSDGDDYNFGHATRPQNEFLRALAKEHSAFLVDAERIFEGRSAHGLVGAELIEDGQHPNLRGYLLLAEGYARALSAAVGEPLRREGVSVESLPRLLSIGTREMIDAHLSSALASGRLPRPSPPASTAGAREEAFRGGAGARSGKPFGLAGSRARRGVRQEGRTHG